MQVQGDERIFSLDRVIARSLTSPTTRCVYTACSGWAAPYYNGTLVKYKCRKCNLRFSISGSTDSVLHVMPITIKKKHVPVDVSAVVNARESSAVIAMNEHTTIEKKTYICTVCGKPKKGHKCAGPPMRSASAMSVSSHVSTATHSNASFANDDTMQTLRDTVQLLVTQNNTLVQQTQSLVQRVCVLESIAATTE